MAVSACSWGLSGESDRCRHGDVASVGWCAHAPDDSDRWRVVGVASGDWRPCVRAGVRAEDSAAGPDGDGSKGDSAEATPGSPLSPLVLSAGLKSSLDVVFDSVSSEF